MNMLNTLLSSGLFSASPFVARAGLSISLFALSTVNHAQLNLVPNWSFEDTGYCSVPVSSQILHAPPWFSANTATPDTYSMDAVAPCGTYMDTTDVIGQWCYQAPFHGQRFAGAYLWNFGDELKEYMEVELLAPMEAGHSYRVAMEISFPECWQYSMDLFGAHFSMDTVFDGTPGVPGVIPVASQAAFHDLLFYMEETDWIHVEDTIIATGGERFMLIGSFTDNASTNVYYSPAPFAASYYYFDAIEVVDVTIIESMQELRLSSSGSTLVVAWCDQRAVDRVVVWEPSGRIVCEQNVDGKQLAQIHVGTALVPGPYIVCAWHGDKRATAKWTKVE